MLSRELCVVLLCCLLVAPVMPRRSSGGAGRGQSASRGGPPPPAGGPPPGNFHPAPAPAPGGGFRPQQQPGGFHPPPPQGGFHPQQPAPGGFRGQPNNFQPAAGQFHPGTGLGSTGSSHTFRNALIGGALGAAGGIIAYEAGKAIIRSATDPFHYQNRNYYWDDHYQKRNGEVQCEMPISALQQAAEVTTTTTTTVAPSTVAGETTTTGAPTTTAPTTPSLNTLQFQDGSRPKKLVWGCKAATEVCCGSDCCPRPVEQHNVNSQPSSKSGPGIGAVILGIIAVLLISCCCCCFLAYFFCRSAIDCCLPQDKQENYQAEYSAQQQQQYPMQSYPQQGYPQQGYPQQYQQPAGGYNHNPSGYPASNAYSYPSQPTY